MTITEQALDLAFPDVPGFKGQGWSSQETAMVVYWLLGNPGAWGQAMTVAREYPDNAHTVADTLHEKIVPRSELEAITSAGGDPSRVNWLEVAHELIERRNDPRPVQEHAGITAQALDLAAAVTVDPEAMKDPGLPVPDDPAAIAIYTAHRVDRTLYELTHSVQRMQAAGKASGDLRRYHAENMARHVQNALDSGHSLKENLQEHYPAEAAELEEVKDTLGLANATGLARGYELNPRSGMISLDLPPGIISPVPGGVSDHHITVVYLGPDVDDEAFARACQRAQEAAAQVPGPLAGTVGGIGTFPPSDGSDGKVPAWAGVVLPGAERLRSALEDLSASEHKDWKPHVTVAYVEPGEALPPPVPSMQVSISHLSVHRGNDEVVRYPIGGGPGDGTVTAQMAGMIAGELDLAVAVSTDAKIATTSHLLASVLNELTHGSRHVKAMLTDDPDSKEWEFDAQHCARHLDGAVEHIGKLRQHYIDNYPPEGKWLTGLRAIAEAAGETPGPQHATENKAVISAQFTGETITGQLDLAGRGGGSPKASPAR